MNNDAILKVDGLKTYFNTDDGIVKAVDGVSFELRKGETLGIVGESGSGKSVTNLSLMKLIPSPPGKIMEGTAILDGKIDILKMNEAQMRELRGNKIAMIFQDPMTSLNPFLRISTQMIETVILHKKMSKKDALKKAIEMLDLVGIPNPEKRVFDYPHQFSGGMRQRVMIAMALSCDPEILIADEPTSALDVTIQAQILELIQALSKRLGTAVIMITHDLGVVAGMCDYVVVMYAGRLVERGTNDEIFDDPKHPYTQGLIKSVPRLDKPDVGRLFSIEGQPPNVIDLPECCPFHPRCNKAMDKCRTTTPAVTILENNREVRCFLYEGEK
ncbi:MAG: ABC transporter ATP-binding protein [Spirochaetia bacterium]|nr:ABC transporter ATP-binding protein [Spirochaetia bacterium]